MREAEFPLGQAIQMRREDDAAGMTGPVFRIERGIIFRQVRIACVAKDAFDEVEICHQRTRNEKTRFHRALGSRVRHGRTNERTYIKRNKAFRRLRRRGGKGQPEQFGGGIHRLLEKAAENFRGHRLLVVGHGQAEVGDVKNSLGGASIAARVVQYALADAMRRENFALVPICIRG